MAVVIFLWIFVTIQLYPMLLSAFEIDTIPETLIVIAAAIIFTQIINFLITKYIEKSSKIIKLNPTSFSFIKSFVNFLLFAFCLYYIFHSIPKLNSLGKTIFAGAGIIAAIVGFASQEAFSNIVSGLFILISKPFSVGDNIKLENKGTWGIVEDITMRHTVLRGIENRRIVIPNSIINREMIQNATLNDERINVHFDILLAPETNIVLAKEIIEKAIEKNPLYKNVLSAAEMNAGAIPFKIFIPNINRDGVKLRATIWCENADIAYNLKCNLFETVLLRFQENNIIIAYNYCTINNGNEKA